MVAALVITLAVEVPIDNRIETWTATTLPADWRSIQARWELFHTSAPSCRSRPWSRSRSAAW
jgi:hypothetical protein